MPRRYLQKGIPLFRFVPILPLILIFGIVGVWAEPRANLEIAAEVSHAPGGMTITPSGSTILSLHQFQETSERVVEITPKGEVRSFPNPAISRGLGNPALKLDSVLGIQIDKNDVIWILDNGRRDESVPKLVGWHSGENRLHRVIFLPHPATIPQSHLNDLAIDPIQPFIYITDPADGPRAALIVVDLRTGLARRVLEGHPSVIPENGLQTVIDGQKFQVTRPDGSTFLPAAGVNPIAIDRRGSHLYFGPMLGKTLYRIEAQYLRNFDIKAAELENRVEAYAPKPICEGISIDSKNNIYISDLQKKAIGVIHAKDRRYEIYVSHEQFQWVDGLCFGNDGRLYFFASQLHLLPVFHDNRDRTIHPFLIFKIRALSTGTVGR